MAGRSDLPRLRVSTPPEQAHSSVGEGRDRPRLRARGAFGRSRPTPSSGWIRARSRARSPRTARRAGGPSPVCATVGTTGTTSVDPGAGGRRHRRAEALWLHVDAAYGGVAAILPERRDVLAGCDRADSIVVNPHKWLFTPIDCSALFCRPPDVLKRAFTLIPRSSRRRRGARSRTTWTAGPQLGRRFRALKLWMVSPRVRPVAASKPAPPGAHAARAAASPNGSTATRTGERIAPVPFSTVVFRAPAADWSARRSAARRPERAAPRGA